MLEHEGDMSLSGLHFVDEHPIIYWNLVWYFKRINLPSHLPGLILDNLERKDGKTESLYDYRNVFVHCCWDNEKLHDDMHKPLYRQWIESGNYITGLNYEPILTLCLLCSCFTVDASSRLGYRGAECFAKRYQANFEQHQMQ